MNFNHRYFSIPKSVQENPGGDYLVEDAGLLTDNKTRIEQMLLAGARLNELSKFYTYDNEVEPINLEDYQDTALTYGIDKLEMSEKLKQFEASLKKRVREAEAARASTEAAKAEAAAKADGEKAAAAAAAAKAVEKVATDQK